VSRSVAVMLWFATQRGLLSGCWRLCPFYLKIRVLNYLSVHVSCSIYPCVVVVVVSARVVVLRLSERQQMCRAEDHHELGTMTRPVMRRRGSAIKSGETAAVRWFPWSRHCAGVQSSKMPCRVCLFYFTDNKTQYLLSIYTPDL
jgi:hypothetical protein